MNSNYVGQSFRWYAASNNVSGPGEYMNMTLQSGGAVSIDDSVTGTGNNQFNYSTGWTSNNPTSGYYDNSQHYSNTTNNYVDFHFTGTLVNFYGSKDSNRGIVALSIDGGPETYIDEYASSESGNVGLWDSGPLSNTTHTMRVRVTGTKNGNSSGYYASIDRAEVYAGSGPTGSIDDSATGTGTNQFNYSGSWTANNPAASYLFYDNSQHYSNTTNDYVTVQFSGTQIYFYGSLDTNRGILAASIDGGSEQTVDEYASSQAGNVMLWYSPQLSFGTHTMKIRVTGSKNGSSSNTYVSIDRVYVMN